MAERHVVQGGEDAGLANRGTPHHGVLDVRWIRLGTGWCGTGPAGRC